MISFVTEDFRKCFSELPGSAKGQAKKTYEKWKSDPFHGSLRFKKVQSEEEVWSIRIGKHWRALGLREGDKITWFWIGFHSDYDKLISQF